MQLLLELFKIIGINSLDEAKNAIIPGDVLKDQNTIDRFDRMVPDLKGLYKSDKLTCLHSNRHVKQRNPCVNMLRQILKTHGYTLESVSCYRGVNDDGKKKYVRCYKIGVTPTITAVHPDPIEADDV